MKALRWSSIEGCEVYVDVVKFKGHENIKATHKTTLEITKEDYLTPRGDCIIGVSASKGLSDLRPEVKQALKSSKSRVFLLIVDAEGNYDVISGVGDPRLELSDPTRIIVRKSNYISPNTLFINADKAAKDLNVNIIRNLRSGSQAIALIVVLTCKN